MKIVVVTVDSHTHKVREGFIDAGIFYGGIARGHVKNIFLCLTRGTNVADVSFIKTSLKVQRFIEIGDRTTPLPRTVVLEGFLIDQSGSYSVQNALLTVDDCVLKIIVDKSSTIVRGETGVAAQTDPLL